MNTDKEILVSKMEVDKAIIVHVKREIACLIGILSCMTRHRVNLKR